MYRLTCLANGRVYVGSTKQTLRQRLAGHRAKPPMRICMHALLADVATYCVDVPVAKWLIFNPFALLAVSRLSIS